MPKRTLNESEQVLVAHLGVFGIWLLTHGRNLPTKCATATAIKGAYRDYQLDCKARPRHSPDNALAGALMRAISAFCQNTGWEPPGSNYETALRDLLRGTDA